MKTKLKAKAKAKVVQKAKAKVVVPKFYTAEKVGSRFDVFSKLLTSKQLKLNTVYTSEGLEGMKVNLYGQKAKVKDLTSYKMYIPVNRDTHKSLKAVNKVDLEVLEVKKGKAVKFKFVKLSK